MLISASKLASIKKAVQQKTAVQQTAKPASPAAKAVQPPDQPASSGSKFLNGMQIIMCVPKAQIEGKDATPKMIKGALDLYTGMHPKDSIDSILATLIVNISNLSNSSLAKAANLPPALGNRHLLAGLKGATVVSDLIKTYHAQHQKGEKVMVGQVNVESGGQAIVGTVETGSKKE